MAFNHNRPLSDFENQIAIIKSAGFNPIAVAQMLFEDTFVFETEKEAKDAYKKLEKSCELNNKDKVYGWWYGKQEFEKEVLKYESSKLNNKIKIYWL